MTDPTSKSSDPADGPGDPGEGTRSTEWAFELDDAILSDDGTAYGDDTPSDATGASAERSSDVSGGASAPLTLSELVIRTDGAVDTGLGAPHDSAILDAKTVFYADSLIFEEDALIG